MLIVIYKYDINLFIYTSNIVYDIQLLNKFVKVTKSTLFSWLYCSLGRLSFAPWNLRTRLKVHLNA